MDDIKPSYFDKLPKITYTCTVCGRKYRAVERGHDRLYCGMQCSQKVHIARASAKNRAARLEARQKKEARKKVAKHK